MNWWWIGVDPGGQSTGIVLRQGDRLVRAVTVTRGDDDFQTYVSEIVEATYRYTTQAPMRPRIAVEDVVPPHWHMNGKASPMNPAHLIGPAIVLGAILGRFGDAIVVAPGGNGSQPLAAYPELLVGKRETGTFGTGKLRHVRSAWDVSVVGERVAQRAVANS